MTDPIVTFLKACLDEDEQMATDACGKGEAEHWQWVTSETDRVVPDGDLVEALEHQNLSLRSVEEYPTSRGSLPSFVLWEVDDATSGALPHIARWSPARVLVEVEAKRRILAIHAAGKAWPNLPEQCVRCSDVAMMWNGVEYPCETVRALALPYDDRPGYDPAWKA